MIKTRNTYFPVSSTTVASINSVDLSLTITCKQSRKENDNASKHISSVPLTWHSSGDAPFSSSSSFEPDAVFVGASSGIIREPLLLLSNCVSAKRLVCATFSITLPPVVYSVRFGFLAALCFFARILRACLTSVRKRKKI